MVETSSRVPSRPPALGWHTHGESANQTLALDICECQRASWAGIAVAQVAGDVSQHSRDNESSKGSGGCFRITGAKTTAANRAASMSSPHTRSTIATIAPFPLREITIVALFGPSSLS